MKATIIENEKIKIFKSKNLNYYFNKQTGVTITFGKTIKEDPIEFYPIIADIEITTICNGYNNTPCPFCYKGNNNIGKNMSFEKFKLVFHNLPKSLTQIAFGVDACCKSNPDTFKIFNYCRQNGVIPNVTVANISQKTADKLSKVCGAVAVSRYEDKLICYESIKKLKKAGLRFCNIHQMLSKETLLQAYETIDDYIKGDLNINAIVFLSLKKCGRGRKYNSISQLEFSSLVNYAMKNKVPIGFDSCSAPKFINSVKNKSNFKQLNQITEPCESTLFSIYINVKGKVYPCSFNEKGEGLDIINCNNFDKDIWYSNQLKTFRNKLINNIDSNKIRLCPTYKI